MMSRVKMMLAATFLGGAVMAGGVAMAQMPMGHPMTGQMGPGMHGSMHDGPGFNASEYDPAQLPEFKGKVSQYTLSPRGEVDGLILADGTEVQISPALSSALVFSVKPGDDVSIRGLKARTVAMVSAVTVTNTASGAVVGGAAAQGHHPWDGPKMEASGKVKALLHSPHGDVNGVLLEDGTSVRMPPHAARKLADTLKPGNTVFVRGFGTTSPLGKAIGALEIGPSADKLTKLDMPHPEHMRDGMMRMHEMMHGGPDGAATPAPATPAAPK